MDSDIKWAFAFDDFRILFFEQEKTSTSQTQLRGCANFDYFTEIMVKFHLPTVDLLSYVSWLNDATGEETDRNHGQ